MIWRSLLLAIAASFLAEGARAQCSCATNLVTNGVSGQNQSLSTALSGNTVCVPKSGGGWYNQEWHQGGPLAGNITDYKKGPADPIDPTKTIGIWTINGNGVNTQVTYQYVTGETFAFSVCSGTPQPGPGSTIGFCESASSPAFLSATLKSGAGACP